MHGDRIEARSTTRAIVIVGETSRFSIRARFQLLARSRRDGAFQSGAVPVRGVGAGGIRAPQELHQRSLRIGRVADLVITQEEFAQRGIPCAARDPGSGEALRNRRGVAIEGWLAVAAVAGP